MTGNGELFNGAHPVHLQDQTNKASRQSLGESAAVATGWPAGRYHRTTLDPIIGPSFARASSFTPLLSSFSDKIAGQRADVGPLRQLEQSQLHKLRAGRSRNVRTAQVRVRRLGLLLFDNRQRVAPIREDALRPWTANGLGQRKGGAGAAVLVSLSCRPSHEPRARE